MKEKLAERLVLIDQAIAKQTTTLHQANADLNMLNGCRQELLHVIHMCDQEVASAGMDDEQIESAAVLDIA